MRNQLSPIASLVGLAMLMGCSRSDTVEISGAVTWKGAPIPQGDVIFASLDPHIPAAAGKISEGAFKFRCKPGEKRVEIRSYRLSGKKTPEGIPIGEMYIPPRYNTQTELSADVTFDGKKQFEFDLKP